MHVLHFARETEHLEGRKSACALKLRSHTGHVSSFWTAGFHESNCKDRAISATSATLEEKKAGFHESNGWLVIIASVFWFQIHSVLTCII